MRLLAVGATGKTGQTLLERLSETHHDVTGLIRNQEQENLVTQFGAKPLLGDLGADVSSLAEGFDAILFVAGSRGKDVEGIDYKGLAKMVDSALQNNVKRFVYISSINIGKSQAEYVKEIKDFYKANGEEVPEGLLKMAEKLGYKTYLDMKTLAEEAIINSELNYTIIRAGLLTQDPGSGKVSVTPGKLNAFGKVSRDNIAQCFIEALDCEKTYRKIYTVLDGDVSIKEAFED